jgi:N-acetylmuramoyl-L-alanine amidase CwlA
MIGSDGLINVKEIYGTPVIVDILPKKSNYSKWIKKDNEYLTNHNTGNSSKGANALMHANYLKNLTESKSWHITIDDKYIIQHLPLNVNGWHCTDGVGSDSGNMNSIGIEGCMNNDGSWSKTRINMIKFNVWCMNNLPNLVSDNWKKTIVPHKHWYNKNCPSVILAESGGFDKFVQDCINFNSNLISIKTDEKWMDILKKVSPIYYNSWISFVKEHHVEGKMNVKGLVEVLFEYNLNQLEKSKNDYSELKNKITKLWDEYNEKFKSIA